MSDSGTLPSSQRIVSSMRSRLGSRFFAASFPAFPFFLSLEPAYHSVFSYMGLGVQGLQMLAFVLNPHMLHGETLTALSRILYSSHLPFWDDAFVSMSFYQYLPLFYLAALLVLGVLLAGLYLVISHTPVMREGRLMTALRFFLHLATSVLFIPIMQSCLSQMICLDGVLWTFRQTRCRGNPQYAVTVVVAAITFAALNAMTALVDTTLCVDDYHSPNPLARKQYITSAVYVLWRTLSCILFHVFISNSTHPAPTGYAYTWLPMYIFFSAGIMALLYVFYLPFLRQTTNRLFTAAFLCTSIIGLISFFSCAGSISPSMAAFMGVTDFAAVDLDGLIVMGLGGVIFLLGWQLADWRVNKELLRSLKQLTDACAEYPDHFTCLFPTGLPEYDIAYRSCSEASNDVADGAFKENRISVSLETPFLTHIRSYTDVEVATRFISTAFRATGRYPTPDMLRLASHIYIKGMYRFKGSATVVLDFAGMINAFTMRPSLALVHCERASVMACTFPTRFRAYRLHANLKVSLNLRDTAYQSICEDAKRAHREILVGLSHFWNKLLYPQTDWNLIASAYSAIARKREDANRLFLKALHQQTSDHELLLKYADFLEQVMLQGERAERLRALAAEEVEGEHGYCGRNGVLRRRYTRRLQALALKTNADELDGAQQIWGLRVDTISVLKAILLLVLLLIAAAMMVVAVVGYRRRVATYQCVQSSAVGRNLHALGDLTAMQYWTLNERFAESGPRLNFINNLASDMLSIQNFLVFGLPTSFTGFREQFMGSPRAVDVSYVSATNRGYNPVSFLSLGYTYAQFIQDVPGVIGWEATTASNVDANSANAQQAGVQLEVTRAALFDGVTRLWEAGGYNASVLACRDWFVEERDIYTGVSAALFGLGVMVIVLLAEVGVQTSPVERLKNRILSLFVFIPKGKLQEIAQQARQRVEAFDQSGDEGGEPFAFHEPEDSTGPMGDDTAPPTPPGTRGSGGGGGATTAAGGATPALGGRARGDGSDAGPAMGRPGGLDEAPPVGARVDGGGGGAVAGEDEEEVAATYGDHQALLWGVEKARPELASGLVGRVRDGREAGGGAGDGERGLSSSLGGAGGVGEVGGEGDVGYARKGMVGQQLRPIGLKEHALMTLLILLLVAVLVSSVGSTLLHRNRAARRNFAARSSLFTHAQNEVLVGAVHLISFFSQGERWLYDTWLTSVGQLESRLPLVLSLSPGEGEMEGICRVASAIQGFSKMNESLESFAAAISGTTSQYDPTSRTVGVNQTGEEARRVLFFLRGADGGESVLAPTLIGEAAEALDAAEELVRTFSTSAAQDTASTRMTLTLIILSICGFVFQLLVIFTVHLRKDSFFLRRSRCGVALLVLSSCALLTTFALGLWIRGTLGDVWKTRLEHASLAGRHHRTVRSYLWPLVLAGSMVQQGERLQALSVLEYFDYVSQDVAWRTFAETDLSGATRDLMMQHGQRLYDLQMIALALQSNASSINPIELRDVTWDFDAEPDAMETRVRYPDNRQLRYTTREADLARHPTVKLMMARDVVSNVRARDTMLALNQICASYFRGQLSDVVGRLSNINARLDQVVDATIGTATASVVLSGILILVLLSQHARYQREQLGMESDAIRDNFASTRMWLCLFAFLLLLSAIFVVSATGLLPTPQADAQLDYLNERAYAVTTSMILAEMWTAGRLSSASLLSNLDQYRSLLESLNARLNSGSTNVYGLSKSLDALLKGINVKLSPRFRYGFNPTTGTQQQNESDWTFPYGVDSAVVAWVHRALELTEAAKESPAEMSAVIERMRGMIMPLLRGLDESSSLFLTAIESTARMHLSITIALSSALAAFVLGVFVFQLLPAARRQVTEEVGYRKLIRLIPPDIREGVPEIREFVSGGSAGAPGAFYSGSGSVRRGSGYAVGGLGLGLGSFEDLATPIIATNQEGIVIKFNRQAEEIFGYSAAEVLGNNVGILMPDRIGRRHDGYLADYARARRPSNRSVFHGQELLARKKGGALFHIRLTVHEMRRGASDRAYVGLAEDISAQVRGKRDEMLSRYIQDEAVVPMIAIDSLGTVLRFNKAAEVCFGRSASEVLDQNVKVLMPEDIAERHDGYLATYLRTREKHAIDSISRARGVRKNGEEFPVELRIKEIVHDNVSTYVGFCRDLSTDAHLEEAVQISQVILETCVVPVICTDLQGRVTLYSRSAERVFGYTAEEVVSNNCKMLMPDAVADHHDGYLERYRTSWTRRTAPIMSRKIMGRCKDGRLIPLLASLHEVKSASSANAAIVGFFRELSEECALERRLDIDEVVAEHHPYPLVVIDSQGIIARVNRAAVLEFGYQHRDELLHKNVKMLMPEDVAARHDDYINRYLLTGIGMVIVPGQDRDVLSPGRRLTAKRRDGSTFPIELRLREVRRTREAGSGGRGTGSGGGGTSSGPGEPRDREDVTDGGRDEVYFIGYLRNLARDIRLERQLAMNRAMMEHAPLPLCLLDGHGRILKANAAAEHTLRARTDELLGLSLAAMLRPAASASGGLPAYAGARPPQLGLRRERADSPTRARHGGGDGTPSAAPPTPSFPTVSADADGGGGGLGPLLDRTSARTLVTLGGHRVPVEVMVRAVGGGSTGSGIDLALPPTERGPAEEEEAPLGLGWDAFGVDLGDASVAQPVGDRVGSRPACPPRALAYMAYLRDTTDDGAAMARAARNTAIAELSPVPLIQFDESGTTVCVNAAAERQLGYTREEMVGRHVGLVLPDPLVLADVLVSAADSTDVGATATTGGSTDAWADTTECARQPKTSGRQQRLHEAAAQPRQLRTKTEMRTKGGRLIPVELSVAEVVTQESAYRTTSTFIAYMYDQSGSIQLEAAKEGCQACAELSLHPVITVNADGIILMCNTALCRSFGYPSPTDLIGRDVGLLMPEALSGEHSGLMRAYHKTRQGRRVGRSTLVQCRRSDGTLFPCTLALREVLLGGAVGGGDGEGPLTGAGTAGGPRTGTGAERGEDGKDVVYVGRFVDRSEDSAVRWAREFMDTLLRLTGGAAVLILSEKAEVQQVSRGAVELLGLSDAAEVVGRPASAVVPGVAWQSYLSLSDSDVPAAGSRRRTVSVQRRDGSSVTVELHVRLVTVARSTSLIACLVDARAREELHARCKMNLALVEHCPLPVLVIDPSGAIQLFSAAAEAFFGYSAAEMISDEATDVLLLLPEMPEDRAVVAELARRGRVGGDGHPAVTGRSFHYPTPHPPPTGADAAPTVDGEAGLQRLLGAGAAASAARREALGTSARPAAVGPCAEEVLHAGYLRGRWARLRHGVEVTVDVNVLELPPRDGQDQAQYALFIIDRSLDTAVAMAQQLSDAVARSMPLPSLVVSEAGIILEANQHAADYVHYTIAELEGQPVSISVPHRSILHPAVAAAAGTGGGASAALREALADPVYICHRVPVLTKSGATRMADVHVCVLPARGSRAITGLPGPAAPDLETGGPSRSRPDSVAPHVLYLTFVDHGSAVDYHCILQRFQTLFSSVSTPVIRLDAETWRVLTFNPAANRLLGLGRDPRPPSRSASMALPPPHLSTLSVSAADGASSHGGMGGGGVGAVARPRYGAVAPAMEGEEGGPISVLTDLVTDPHALKQLKRFVTWESRHAKTVADRNVREVPSLRLRTWMRVLAGYSAEDDRGPAAHQDLTRTSSISATMWSPSRGAGLWPGPSAVDASAAPRGRMIEVELLFELVGHRLLLYIKDVALERRQQLHTSLLAAMRSTLHEPYMVVSDDDVIVELSEAASRLLGYHLPPDGTINANRLVEGGIVNMYSETGQGGLRGVEDSGGPVMLGFLPGGGGGSGGSGGGGGATAATTAAGGLVVATLELDAGCPFATGAGTDVMRMRRPTSPPAPDHVFEPLLLRHSLTESDGRGGGGVRDADRSRAGARGDFSLVPDLGATVQPPPAAPPGDAGEEARPRLGSGSTVGHEVAAGPTAGDRSFAATSERETVEGVLEGSVGTEGGARGQTIRAEVRARRRVIPKVPCRCVDGRSVPLDLRLCEVRVPLTSRPRGGERGLRSPSARAAQAAYGDDPLSSCTRSTLREASLMNVAGGDGAEEDEAAATMARFYVVFLRDVSARQQLDTHIMLGSAILEKNPAAIVVTNVSGTILKFNAAAERLLKFDREHAIGKNVSLLMPSHDSSLHDAYSKSQTQSKERHAAGAPRVVVVECRDGEHVSVELNLLEVMDDSNTPYMLIGFFKRIERDHASSGNSS